MNEPVDSALDQLVAALRGGGLNFADDPAKVRADFEATLATIPVAGDIDFTQAELGGVPALAITPPGVAARGVLVYLHGGAFIAGSAWGYRGLAGELARAAGLHCLSLNYRLAPEHPFPAAVEDAVAAYRALLAQGQAPEEIVVAGDSAGGGLTIALLVALRERGLPQPRAALAISPWADLTGEADSLRTKAVEDPSLTQAGLASSARHYLGAADPRDPLASPVFARLAGLAPLLIQVGSAEILLDDAVALARAAGGKGVAVRLEIWPRMVHVWHAFGFMLAQGREALTVAGAFLGTAKTDSLMR